MTKDHLIAWLMQNAEAVSNIGKPESDNNFGRAAALIASQAARIRELEEGPLAEIAAERRRQVEAEGWTPEHDDQHKEGSLACAAGCYAIHAGLPEAARVPKGYAPADWPWDASWWKPKDPRRDLVRAGALILAEIERLDRSLLSRKGGE